MATTTEKAAPAEVESPEEFVPKVGQIVLYQLSETDCTRFAQAALVGVQHGSQGRLSPYTDHGSAEPGLCLPAVVTATWSPECVNLHVLGDQAGTLWVSARVRGEDPGEWRPCDD